MSKLNQVYGLGQGLINVLPPPIFFQNAPTAAQDNYSIGQLVYTGTSGSYDFYIYAGAGVWTLISDSDGPIVSVSGTSPINASTVDGVATISMTGPANVTTLTNHGVLIGQGTAAMVATAVGATGTVLAGVTGADPAFTGSPSVSGSLTAGTTVTATLGDITATNGNLVASTAGTGILLNSSQASGDASGPVVVNGRSGRVTFTGVSIAAAADLTLTLTNSSITASTTEVMLSMSGATTGSALSIKSKTASAGSLAIVVTNGTGATTTTEDIQFDFLVLNA